MFHIEFALFNELEDHVEAALELTIDVYLREGGPLGVELEPLPDPLVSENVKRLDVPVAFGFERVYKPSCELASRSIQGALDKHHERVGLNQVFDLAESQLLLLLE